MLRGAGTGQILCRVVGRGACAWWEDVVLRSGADGGVIISLWHRCISHECVVFHMSRAAACVHRRSSCRVFRETTTNLGTKLTFQQLFKEIRQAAVLQLCQKKKKNTKIFMYLLIFLLSSISFASPKRKSGNGHKSKTGEKDVQQQKSYHGRLINHS